MQGPKVREFEEKWSAFTGARHSIAVTSCTSALHLSLASLGFGPGDEAIRCQHLHGFRQPMWLSILVARLSSVTLTLILLI